MARRKNKPKNESRTVDSRVPPQRGTSSSDKETDTISDEKEVTKTGKNDAAWYMADPALANDGARIPFNIAFGSNLRDYGIRSGGANDTYNYGSGWGTNSTPGVMLEFLKPSYGRNSSMQSPLNVCAQAFYTHVRYMNSGRKNYDPVDLMIYALHFADVYSFILWGVRTYNLAYMYSQRNFYIGRVMLESEGWDVDLLIAELANFRYMLNVIINKVSSYVLPGDINIFKRRVFLYSNYYIENPYGNIKDQLYAFTPDGFYYYDLDSNGAGKLSYVTRSRTFGSMNPTAYNSLFNFLMAKVVGDEDFGIMSGDILKAYGSNIIGLSSIPEEGGLLPVFDPLVLAQFKNATICNINRPGNNPGTVTINGTTVPVGEIVQSTNGILYSTEGYAYNNNNPPTMETITVESDRMISVENPDPDVGDVLEATRLTLHADTAIPFSGGGYLTQMLCGSEVCTFALWSRLKDDGTIERDRHIGNYYLWDSNNANLSLEWANVYNVCAYANFKYAPMVWFIYGTITTDPNLGEGVDFKRIIPACNLENVALLHGHEVRRLHEIALLSLCYVPGVAKMMS